MIAKSQQYFHPIHPFQLNSFEMQFAIHDLQMMNQCMHMVFIQPVHAKLLKFLAGFKPTLITFRGRLFHAEQ